MAKDGTARGGARVGAGRKGKAVTDRINEGETSNITVLKAPDDVELKGADMPEPKSYMKARQKNEKGFVAEEIYRKHGCG